MRTASKLLSAALLLLAFHRGVAQDAAKRPPITGIAFVSFAEADAAAADRFYGKELGLTRVLTSGGESVEPLHMFAVNSQQWISFRVGGATPAPANSRLRIVGFTTTNLPQMTKYLAEHGYPSSDSVSPGELGIRDPEGNFIIFVQKDNTEGVLHSKPSPTAISRRIIHAGFVVNDADKENRFWRDILGFRPYWHGGHDDSSTDYVSQQVPDGTDWLEYMLNTSPDADAKQRGGSNHVSLGVEKMSAVVAQLQKNGCTGPDCTAAKLGRDGKVQLNLFDPSLSRVEVMEYKPSGTTCCSKYTAKHPSAGDPE